MNILVVGRIRPLITKWFDELSESETKLTTYVSPSVEFAELVLKYISRCSAIIITLELDDKELIDLVHRLNLVTRTPGSIRIGACQNDNGILLWENNSWKPIDCRENVSNIGVSLGLVRGGKKLEKQDNILPTSYQNNPIDIENSGLCELSMRVNLTPRQREVLLLVNMGKSNKEIARELVVSEGTVKVHCKAIFRALGVSNRTQAAVLMASGAYT